MIVTSNGRGRLKLVHIVFPITCSRAMQPRSVNRWRQRLNTASRTISATVAIVVSQNEKPLSTASAMLVSQGVRRRATCRRIAESSRSVKPPNAVELWARIAQSSNTPNAMSQPVPVVPMCFGRGGGAPDGRRRRRVRVAVGGAGSCGSATGGGSGWPVATSSPTVTTAPDLRARLGRPRRGHRHRSRPRRSTSGAPRSSGVPTPRRRHRRSPHPIDQRAPSAPTV